MTDQRKRLGQAGEGLAERALVEAGLTILDRNWRCSVGEIDIIAQESAPDFTKGGVDSDWLVFVEVRTRRGTRYGTALQSITPRKQLKLKEVAYAYIYNSSWGGPWRIDVVGVQMDGSGKLLAVDHIRHAVQG